MIHKISAKTLVILVVMTIAELDIVYTPALGCKQNRNYIKTTGRRDTYVRPC
jgi:hypothetical protein